MGLCSSAHAAGLYLLESCRRARAVGFETWMHPPASSCLCQLPHACAAFPCSCWPFLVGAVSLCPWRGRVLNTADATIERGLLVSVAEPFHRGVIAKRMTSSGTRSNIPFDGIRHSQHQTFTSTARRPSSLRVARAFTAVILSPESARMRSRRSSTSSWGSIAIGEPRLLTSRVPLEKFPCTMRRQTNSWV